MSAWNFPNLNAKPCVGRACPAERVHSPPLVSLGAGSGSDGQSGSRWGMLRDP